MVKYLFRPLFFAPIFFFPLPLCSMKTRAECKATMSRGRAGHEQRPHGPWRGGRRPRVCQLQGLSAARARAAEGSQPRWYRKRAWSSAATSPISGAASHGRTSREGKKGGARARRWRSPARQSWGPGRMGTTAV